MQEAFASFPPVEIATKLLLSLGIGLLIGFEREWSHKDLGARTFTIVSLLGMLAALIAPTFVFVGLAGVIALVVVVNLNALKRQRPLESTTSCALLVTFALGVLIGQGHVFTPTASAIVMTLLLSLKPQFSRFAGGLTDAEVRGAVLMGLIGFVIFPVLPNRFVDPWKLLNPREAWFTIILIAGIGFLNYVLLRLYSQKGLYYTAVFGGLVNSTAAIAELSRSIHDTAESQPLLMMVNLLTIVAMLSRNLALLLIFSPPAGLAATGPIVLMSLATVPFIWRLRRTPVHDMRLRMGSPISLRKLLSFGAIFVSIEIAAALGQRLLGAYGTVIISVLGGLASSASSTAAVAALSRHGQVTPFIAAGSTVLASIASSLVNLPILYRTNSNRTLVRNLALISGLITVVGLLALAAYDVWSSRA